MKEKMLENIRNECIKAVDRSYPNERKVIVFGEGNPDAQIVLVGEAPGEKETELVRPFVGAAGKNLDEFLAILCLKREDIYITNTVKFRPFKVNPKTGRLSNRPPNDDEIRLCLPFLLKQIDVINPKVIVTLGNTPLRALTGNKEMTIGQSHGKLIDKMQYHIFPLYHPASIIYNINLKDVYIKDIEILKDYISGLHQEKFKKD